MKIRVEMLTKAVWSFRSESGLEFFETCQGAMTELMARGVARSQIVMDYRVEPKRGKPRALAERFVKAYGEDGRRFMPAGELIGEECPPAAGEIERRQLRKRVLVCPHCNKPIRVTPEYLRSGLRV